MGKAKLLRQDLQNFLSLFNFEIDKYYDLDKRLNKKEHINIKDKNGDIIGELYMVEKEKLYFKANLNGNYFLAEGYCPEGNNRYFFDFIIKKEENKKNLKGSVKSRKDFENACLDFFVEMSIYENKNFIANFKFGSAFELFDITKYKQKINYHRNRLKYNRDGRSLLLLFDGNDIFYNDMDYDEQHLNRITGGYDFKVENHNETYCVEEEFNRVISEICPDYFDFIQEQSGSLDEFYEDLFKNTIELTYRNINPMKMNYITNSNVKEGISLKKTFGTNK